MNIEKGDFVTRKSHNNDIIFKVISISEDTVYLKGVYDRLYADSDIFDLVKTDEKPDDFFIELDINNDRTSYFYLPGKILHIDGDNEYLEKCLKFYKTNKIYAVGKKINENDIAKQIPLLLKEIKPDILVITGHDAYYAKKGNKKKNLKESTEDISSLAKSIKTILSECNASVSYVDVYYEGEINFSCKFSPDKISKYDNDVSLYGKLFFDENLNLVKADVNTGSGPNVLNYDFIRGLNALYEFLSSGNNSYTI